MSTTLRETYLAFIGAVASGDTNIMRSFIEPGFKAELPGISHKMGFKTFVAEIERQRRAFSDLAQRIEWRSTSYEGCLLHAEYVMIVTFDGELANADGRSIHPTGAVVEIHSVDHVLFNSAGKIKSIVSKSDIAETIKQMTT